MRHAWQLREATFIKEDEPSIPLWLSALDHEVWGETTFINPDKSIPGAKQRTSEIKSEFTLLLSNSSHCMILSVQYDYGIEDID